MIDTTTINPLVFQPEKQLWLRTIFLQAIVVRKEQLETVARILGVSRTTAYRWRRNFLMGNENGLMDCRFGPSTVMIPDGLRKPRGGNEDNDGAEKNIY